MRNLKSQISQKVKQVLMYSFFLLLITSSCSKGLFLTIDGKRFNYSKNAVVIFSEGNGHPVWNGIEIISFNKSGDSSFLNLAASQLNGPIIVGDYSNTDTTKYKSHTRTSGFSFYTKEHNRYVSGGDEVYGPTFVITSLTRNRIKGWFSSKVVDINADTVKPSNTITLKGRFNLPIKKEKRK